jgi:hypothetical protein
MSIPTWVTPAGSLGTIPQGVFYSIPLVATAGAETVYYRAIAGVLPPGVFIDETGILSGTPNATARVEGIPLPVQREITDTFVIRAFTNSGAIADRTFSLTISRQSTVVWITPPGTIGKYVSGSQIVDLALQYRDTSSYAADVVTIIGGSLPPGLTMSTTGVINGYLIPGINPSQVETTYSFTAKVSNDVTSDVRTFSISVYTRALLTADNTVITADNTYITDDTTTQLPPIITTVEGSIGSTRSDNFYAFQFTGKDFYGNPFEFIAATELPPGLTLDPNSGWLYGFIPYGGVVNTDYTFDLELRSFYDLYPTFTKGTVSTKATDTYNLASITLAPGETMTIGSVTFTASINTYGIDLAAQLVAYLNNGTSGVTGQFSNTGAGHTIDHWTSTALDNGAGTVTLVATSVGTATADLGPAVLTSLSKYYTFSLLITGPVNTDVVWLTPTDAVERAKTPSSLGLIDNGATSTFYVAAENVSGIPLQYQLVSGSASRLPQGLQLLPSGHIAGRVSFNVFALDAGTTTFDVGLNTVTQPTTFDLVNTFTVNAYSVNGLVSVDKTFSITVVPRYGQPYDNLYIQAMPPESDRALLAQLLQNPTIFPPNLLYRNDDPNFGVATRVVYNHAYGLTAATLDDYVASLNLNHYWKNLVLGEIKTARALDDAGNTIYEVVYSEVVDDLVNNQGTSVGKQVTLPYPVTANGSTINIVYPNSLQDMRDQVVDVVGQISNVLPRWMLSRQIDGRVLGFTPAWVIAYTNPGASGQIAYNIQTQFAEQLNLVDFTADRYELDNFLTKNWNREEQHWGYNNDAVTPYPASLTTFDIVGLPPFQTYKITLVGAGTATVNQTYAQIEPYRYAGTTNSNWIMFSVDFGNTWRIGHSLSATVYYESSDLINWTTVAGANPAPTATFYQVGDIVIYQTVNTTTPGPYVYKDGAYRISKPYKCIQNTVPGILPTDTDYWTDTGEDLIAWDLASWENNANVITTWEDNYQTLATWTYATPGANNLGTTFDNNSLLFTAPVDMYSSTATTDYDRYLLFPKRNIIQNLPQVNQVFWVNDYSDLVAWVNNLDQSVIWTTENV